MSDTVDPVSLTIGQDLLDDLDSVIEKWDYASRSEAVRNALRDFLTEYRWRSELAAHQRGSVVMVYNHHTPGLLEEILNIQHESPNLITAVQHVHLTNDLCLETLVVDGSGEEIIQLTNQLQSMRGVQQVKLTLVSE